MYPSYIFLILLNAFVFHSFAIPARGGLTGLGSLSLLPENLVKEVTARLKTKSLLVNPNQPISVSGRYAFQAPGKGDQRGPCPGLNALANHHYVSHNGITSYAEVVWAINQGMWQM